MKNINETSSFLEELENEAINNANLPNNNRRIKLKNADEILKEAELSFYKNENNDPYFKHAYLLGYLKSAYNRIVLELNSKKQKTMKQRITTNRKGRKRIVPAFFTSTAEKIFFWSVPFIAVFATFINH